MLKQTESFAGLVVDVVAVDEDVAVLEVEDVDEVLEVEDVVAVPPGVGSCVSFLQEYQVIARQQRLNKMVFVGEYMLNLVGLLQTKVQLNSCLNKLEL